MTGSPRVIAAAVGGLLLCQLPAAHAQAPSAPHAVTRLASVASGSIGGIVRDEQGAPIPGAVVSALGAKTVVAVTDQGGRFELRPLSPGPYLLRAHVTGFISSRGQIVEVRASTRTASSIALRHANLTATPSGPAGAATSKGSSPIPVLKAAVGGSVDPLKPATSPAPEPAGATPPVPDSPNALVDADPVDAAAPVAPVGSVQDDRGETAWRLKHLRRGILKDLTMPESFLADDAPEANAFGAPAAPARLAASLFAGVPITGQVNLLTTGSFDSPKELFNGENFSRGIAYFSLAAPVREQGDWSMRGALTQGDISSWFVAGAYATRLPARHRYDLGLSYSTQRYDGGNPAALREVTDGSRNVGAVYGFDTFTLTPEVALTFGARFSRYDYLEESSLLSPRIELALSPVEHFRLNAVLSSRALAPGAEEFLPPADTGVWLPPQRTFSSIVEGRGLQAERTEHLAVEAERDFGASTVSVRAFRQRVNDQLVTLFGIDVPFMPRAEVGHYFVANTGDVDATGWSAGFRTTLVSRVHSSVEYTSTRGRWNRTGADTAHLAKLVPSVLRANLDRVHDVSTAIETNVPETSTRILVVCRVSSLGPASSVNGTAYDSRFDVQVHQSLPFMDFSTARWEMLLAVRNTFHEGTGDSSIYDEFLVVRPPKRLVGGLTLRF